MMRVTLFGLTHSMIIPIPALIDNYIWAIIHHCDLMVFDPGDADPVLDYIKSNRLDLKAIFLTHYHLDHVGGVPRLLSQYPNSLVYGPRNPEFKINHQAAHRQIISLPPYTFQIWHTPGHTADHWCYYEPKKAWLFSGDTLFSAGCGRLFSGTMTQLFHSLEMLNELPDHAQLFAGHEYTRANLRFAASVEPENFFIKEYEQFLKSAEKTCSLPSTLGLERQINPFLRIFKEDFAAFKAQKKIASADAFHLFEQLRRAKDLF